MAYLPPQRNTKSELCRLRQIINESLDVYEAELESGSIPSPSLDVTQQNPMDNPSFLASPRLFEARRALLGALGYLKALVQPPSDKIVESSLWIHETSALHLVVETKLANILLAANAGLSAEELGKKIGVEPMKLARILRLLSIQHWVKETSENVFAPTRLTQYLAEPSPTWHFKHRCFHEIKAAISLTETLTDPVKGPSYEPNETAFNVAYQTKEKVFDYLAQSPDMLTSFAISLAGLSAPSLAGCLADYPWAELGKTTIVDIGGGQGSFTGPLLQHFPGFKLILQERPEVIPLAQQYLSATAPSLVEGTDPRVVLEVHDFFTPQKYSGPEYTYLMRHIIHDWPDHKVVEILHALAPAMIPPTKENPQSGSKLILVETVIEPGTEGEEVASLKQELQAIDNHKPYQKVKAPYPLPQNFGEASRVAFQMDISMLVLLNALERTESRFTTLLDKAGYKINKIYPVRGLQSIIETSLKVPGG